MDNATMGKYANIIAAAATVALLMAGGSVAYSTYVNAEQTEMNRLAIIEAAAISSANRVAIDEAAAISAANRIAIDKAAAISRRNGKKLDALRLRVDGMLGTQGP